MWIIISSNQGFRAEGICQFREEEQMYRMPDLQGHLPVTGCHSHSVSLREHM